MNKKIILILVILIIQWGIILGGYYLSGLQMVSQHESAHKEIFKEYSINSTIKINYIHLSGMTIPEDNSTCNEYCKLSQNEDDIIGYHFLALGQELWVIWLVTLTCVISTLLLIIIAKSEDK